MSGAGEGGGGKQVPVSGGDGLRSPERRAGSAGRPREGREEGRPGRGRLPLRGGRKVGQMGWTLAGALRERGLAQAVRCIIII